MNYTNFAQNKMLTGRTLFDLGFLKKKKKIVAHGFYAPESQISIKFAALPSRSTLMDLV